tara:strand:- start:108 stop:251 length:144 start_codon:yes stop_codon:yes gene_type:complete
MQTLHLVITQSMTWKRELQNSPQPTTDQITAPSENGGDKAKSPFAER